MAKSRILLMYISDRSGHHRASLAVEKALHILSDDVETLNVNSFNYTTPILEKIVTRTYMGVIKRRPEFWGYLYDNPKVVKNTQKLRELVHKYGSRKTRILLERFKPDAVICTQAFPCGIIADYKKTHGLELLLAGVLTDYAPHSYWFYDNVDIYFVPSEETKERLISNGIANDKIVLTGIPVDPDLTRVMDKEKILGSLDFSAKLPTILIMGGSQGLGPIKEVLKILNGSNLDFQLIVVAGGNKKLYDYLKKNASKFAKKTAVFGYTTNVDALMEVSSFVITKPGGITISEALTKNLPILIVNPIPGHEQMNTDYLLKNQVAIKVDRLEDIEVFVKDLLTNTALLNEMRKRAKSLARPNSAVDIAKTVLERI